MGEPVGETEKALVICDLLRNQAITSILEKSENPVTLKTVYRLQPYQSSWLICGEKDYGA